jgi:hypothetical protein
VSLVVLSVLAGIVTLTTRRQRREQVLAEAEAIAADAVVESE